MINKLNFANTRDKHSNPLFKSLLLTLALFGCNIAYSQMTCDVDLTGSSTTVNIGSAYANQTACLTSGTFSGTINVYSGGTMCITGNVATTVSVAIFSGGKLIINQGSTLTTTGSFSFNAEKTLEFSGDPACKSLITKGGGNLIVTWGGSPGASGKLTTTSGIWINGATWAWGTGTRGSATVGTTTPCGTTTLCTCATVDAGAIGSNQTICYNTAPATLTSTTAASGGDGLTYDYQWQSSTNNATWSDIGGATNATYTPGALTANTYFRREITSGVCGTAETSSVLVTVRSQFAAGSIASAQTTCYNTAPASLTSGGLPTGGAGGYTYQWQSSTDNSTWGNIGGASGTPYSPGALTTSTYFRRADIDGSCGTLYTSSLLINVYSDFSPGSIGTAQSICYNTVPNALTNVSSPTGGTGAYTYQWQSSTDNATWGNIGSATGTTYSPGALTTGTYYRRAETSGACGTVYTPSVLVTVYDDLTSGTIGTAQTICYNANPAGLTNIVSPTGGTGAYTYQWQSSTDNATWGNIGGATSSTYSPGALSSNTYYRRAATSGSCGTVFSSSILITVRGDLAAGSIGTAQAICYNAVPAGLTSTGLPSGGAGGYTYQWQSSTDNSTWGNIGGATSTAYNPGALTTSTYFRRGDIDGSCGTDYTSSILVTVHADLAAGTIGSDQTIAHGATPSALTSSVAASGGGGFSYQWQISVDGSSYSNIVGASAATYNPPGAITQMTWYRRAATSTAAEACGTVYTTPVIMTVEANVCSGGTPPNLEEETGASGGTGAYSYQWQISTDGSTFSDIAGATASTYTPASITADTWYRRAVTSGACTAFTIAVKASMTSDPGGIGVGLAVWLKADAGTGNISSQWEDQSGNGNHYTAVGSPAVSAGDSSSNYNAFIELTNSQGFNAPVGAALASEHTIFVIARKTSSDNNGRILDGHTGNYAWGHEGSYGKSLVINSSPSAGTSSPASTNSAETKMLQTFKRSSGGAYIHRVDGASTASYGSSDDPVNVQIDINQGNSGYTSSCRVFEVVIYNTALSNADMEIVESYLMTKYGLGTNNNTYQTSAGGTTYDITSYNNDIIGIGKECFLNQKQSGSEDDSCRIWVSNGAWAATNSAHSGTIANDVSYVMIGHNTGLLRATAAANAEKPGAIVNRLEREWKITNTNFDDDFTIELEWDSALAVDLADVRFLVDDDGDFSNATIYSSGDQGMSFAFGSIIIKDIPVAVVPKGATKFVTIGAVDATVLPVELLSFNAIKHEDAVKLIWVTAAEINNDYFEIERSADGEQWEVIGSVGGAGTSTEKITYEFVDYQFCSSACYYRLKQVDYDESYDYSDVKLVQRSADDDNDNTALKIYPIPVGETSTIAFTAGKTDTYLLSMNSISGERILESKVVCSEGHNTFEVATAKLSKGIYYILMRDVSGKILNRTVFTK